MSGNRTFTIVDEPEYDSNAAHVFSQYRVTEFVGGVMTNQQTGTIYSGDPNADLVFSITPTGATYIVMRAAYFANGAISNFVVPVQFGATNTIVAGASWKLPQLTLNCRDAICDISTFGVYPPTGTRTSSPAFFDGDGNQIGVGTILNATLPENKTGLGYPITFGFSGGLDVTQWTDLPPAMNPVEVCAIGFSFVDCV